MSITLVYSMSYTDDYKTFHNCLEVDGSACFKITNPQHNRIVFVFIAKLCLFLFKNTTNLIQKKTDSDGE